MATGDYCGLQEVREHVGIEASDTSRDLLIQSLITSVSRQIDRICRRQFYSTTETRYFDYIDPYTLWLDKDLISVTTLTNGNGDVLTVNTHVYLWPYDGPPYRRIDIKRDTGQVFQWSGTAQRAISVAGTWGFSTTPPDDVKRACILWIADYLSRQGDEGVAEATISGGDTLRTRYTEQNPADPPPLAALLLQPYRFIEFA